MQGEEKKENRKEASIIMSFQVGGFKKVVN